MRGSGQASGRDLASSLRLLPIEAQKERVLVRFVVQVARAALGTGEQLFLQPAVHRRPSPS